MEYKNIEKNIKNNSLIKIFSPSYALYNKLQDREETLNIGRLQKQKRHNRYVANLMKHLYFLIAIYFFILFLKLNFNRIMLHGVEYSLLYNILLMIFFIIVPFYIMSVITKQITDTVELIRYNCICNYRRHYLIYDILTNIRIENLIVMDITIIGLIGSNFHISNMSRQLLVYGLIYYFGVSRPIHFIVVFIPNFIKKLESNTVVNSKHRVRLLLLTIGSYINIILDYTILFYICNNIFISSGSGFEVVGVNTIFDVMYILVNNSEFTTNNILLKFWFVIMKVSIFILLSGNLALFLNSKIENEELRK